MASSVISFNKIFKPVNECKKRYRVLKGSAGSGKSVNIAQDYIIKLMDMKYKGANLLVVRKVAESNRNSTFAELTSAIFKICGDKALQLWSIKDLEITSNVTGNKIIFAGFNDVRQREKVKSINFMNGKLTWIWCEEATELNESDVDILDDRLRGILPNDDLYYQLTLSFNPVSATHWIKRRYFDLVDDETFTHHSTYLDNRFIDAGYHKRMELRKITDPEGYQVYALGNWGETSGIIFTNFIVKEISTNINDYDDFKYGQDFGFNHANAILDVGIKDGDIYILKELYVNEKDTNEIIQLASNYNKTPIMYCDCAEPDRIKMWRKVGFKAYGVKKGAGSVAGQIDWLKQRTIYIHPDCINTIAEISQWRWQKDKDGNYIDVPVPFFDDAMAALRYAVELWVITMRVQKKSEQPKPQKYNFKSERPPTDRVIWQDVNDFLRR